MPEQIIKDPIFWKNLNQAGQSGLNSPTVFGSENPNLLMNSPFNQMTG